MVRNLVFTLIAFLAFSANAFAQTYQIVTEEYPPYEYLHKGDPSGMDIEILASAAKKAGITLNYQFVPWTRAEWMAKNGHADGIISLMKNAEREKYLYYPKVNLCYDINKIFANSSFVGNPTKLSELKGIPIGAVKGNLYGPIFDNSKDIIKVDAIDISSLMKLLSAGRYNLAVTNVFVGNFTLKELGYTGIRMLPIDLGAQTMYIGFSKTAPKGKELYEKLDKALSAMQKSGELDAIRKKYMK